MDLLWRCRTLTASGGVSVRGVGASFAIVISISPRQAAQNCPRGHLSALLKRAFSPDYAPGPVLRRSG